VTSPNYPNDYPNDKGCTIRKVPRTFPLAVTSFDTEPRVDYRGYWSCGGGCCDYLEIDGLRYCGNQGPDVGTMFDALLKITVVSGWNVKGKGNNEEGTGDRDGWETDPYVKVSVNDGIPKTTAVRDDTDKPVWNEEFDFGGQPTGSTIRVELLDQDGVIDDHMGSDEFSVPDRTGAVVLFVSSEDGEGNIRLDVTFDVDVAHRGSDITWYSDSGSVMGGMGWELCWPHDTPPSPEDGVDCNCTTKKTTLGGGNCTCYSCGETSECDANKCDKCGAPVGDCHPSSAKSSNRCYFYYTPPAHAGCVQLGCPHILLKHVISFSDEW